MKRKNKKRRTSPKEQAGPKAEEILTFEEAAVFLKVNHTKLRKLIHQENLPYTSLTRTCYDDSDIRLLKSQIIEWLKVKIATQKGSLPYSDITNLYRNITRLTVKVVQQKIAK